MILSRLPTKGLDSPATHLEYFAKNRTWKAGIDGLDALVVIETGHSEMSVRHHEEINKWLAVSGAGFLSDRIMLRTAAALTGPWSEWRPAHRFSEMSRTGPEYDKDTWCYAVKEHIEFSSGGKILVTYACNSVDLHKQIAIPGLYRPRAVLIALDPVLAPLKNSSDVESPGDQHISSLAVVGGRDSRLGQSGPAGHH